MDNDKKTNSSPIQWQLTSISVTENLQKVVKVCVTWKYTQLLKIFNGKLLDTCSQFILNSTKKENVIFLKNKQYMFSELKKRH